MKVKELIEKLKQFDSDLSLAIEYDGGYWSLDDFDIIIKDGSRLTKEDRWVCGFLEDDPIFISLNEPKDPEDERS